MCFGQNAWFYLSLVAARTVKEKAMESGGSQPSTKQKHPRKSAGDVFRYFNQ